MNSSKALRNGTNSLTDESNTNLGSESATFTIQDLVQSKNINFIHLLIIQKNQKIYLRNIFNNHK